MTTATFFTAVSQALTDSSKHLNIDIAGLEGGRIKVTLSANIGVTPESASPAEKKLRAAIAKPMVLSGTPEEVETALYARVSAHAEVVNTGLSALDEIRKLSAAAVEAAKPSKSAAKPVQPPASAASQGDDDVEDDELNGGADSAPAAEAAPVAPVENGAFASLAGKF
ncbi:MULTISPECIES: PRTRC system protein E [Pseudomonas]|uniref:PRTRC system protein E n=1 Tax=Pseudomonas nitroreducens TaxID=46680 RepID=A0A6G6J7T3_PSENT|nr:MULTISPECIES: PRTRC system protein E [Pseudomonas]MDU4254150.1 PRTRC system protein E [Pseudomonas sp.]QIE91263.1 PRTRC system protein E [Pseudomonas nitroreducens]